MKLSYSVAQHGNLYPQVYNCLRSLPEIALHHSEHGLRHPLGIYSRSLHRVTQAFQEVLNENDKIYQTPMDAKGECNFETSALLKAQQELLDAFMAHIDDCYQILKALYPVNRNQAKNVSRFADRWLEQAKHPTVKQFKDHVMPYRETIAPIVNKIKHEHGRLCSIVVRNPFLLQDARARIAGYFIEGVDRNGTLGPDTKIHGGNYAISIHRDLRYHFVHLYKMGHFLADALIRAINDAYNLQFIPAPYRNGPPAEIEEIKNIAERIAGLPFLFYINEVVKPISTVEIVESENDIYLILTDEFLFKDVRSLHASIFTTAQAAVQYHGDSVTRSWRLLYQGGHLNITVNKRNEITGISVVDGNK
jgi:hypothetical protein